MTEEDVPNTTFLKWVVGTLGIMIVGVASAIGIILYKRAMADTEPMVPEASSPATVQSTQAAAYGSVAIKVPDGMSVLSVNPQGYLVYVTYGNSGAAPVGMIVLNGGTGAKIGQFVFEK